MTSEPDWAKVEADFKEEGYLAPSAEVFRHHFRSKLSEWFEVTIAINRLAHRLYREGSRMLPGRPVKDPFAIGLQLMARCLSSFQGAVLLAERGLGTESQALVRMLFESAFWMGYLHKDSANAVPQLVRETLKAEIGLFEASQRHLHGLNPETQKEVERQIAGMKAACAELPRPPDRVEELARKAGYPQMYFFYKDLSGAAAHTSMKSIQTFLHLDEAGEVAGHQIGPDEEAVGKAVWLNCRAMLLAIDILGSLEDYAEYELELSQLSQRVVSMEPGKGG